MLCEKCNFTHAGTHRCNLWSALSRGIRAGIVSALYRGDAAGPEATDQWPPMLVFTMIMMYCFLT